MNHITVLLIDLHEIFPRLDITPEIFNLHTENFIHALKHEPLQFLKEKHGITAIGGSTQTTHPKTTPLKVNLLEIKYFFLQSQEEMYIAVQRIYEDEEPTQATSISFPLGTLRDSFLKRVEEEACPKHT